MDGVVEPEVGLARLAGAWRQASRERSGACGTTHPSEQIDDLGGVELARAILYDVSRRRAEADSLRPSESPTSRAAHRRPSRLNIAAARFGAAHATHGRSVYDLVADIMALERAALRMGVADPCVVHAAAECAMLAGTAAFTRAIAETERRRVRDVRHDLTNAVGTVRNAILLMDEQPSPDAREHFLDIARRNTVTAQQLVREHLSDAAAAPAWLDCSRHSAATEQPELPLADSALEERQDIRRSDERDDRHPELR